MKKALVILAMVLMAGCAQHFEIAKVGPYDLIATQTWHMVSPSTTDIFIFDNRDQTLKSVNQGVGGGVLSIAAMPIATVTAAHELADGIARSGDNVSTTNTTSSLSEGSEASAEGGSAGSMAMGGNADSKSGAVAGASSNSVSTSSARQESKNVLTNSNHNQQSQTAPKPVKPKPGNNGNHYGHNK